MTHKMQGTGTNINIYFNGAARPDNEKKSTTFGSFDYGYNGNLEIGTSKIGEHNFAGYIMMDELLIYEHAMSAADIVKLYNIFT